MGNKKRSKSFDGMRIEKGRSDDLIIITIKNMNKVIHKQTCPLNDKNKMYKMLKMLELKGFIDLSLLKKEKDWF